MDKPETSMLIKLCAYFPSDIGFATRARLLQSLWREMYGWLMDKEDAENRLQSQGLYPRRLYRNKLYPEFTRKRGVNFLTPRIRDLVTQKIIEIRENGGINSDPKIWNNLLSSQPLCFNLFREISFDHGLGTRFLEHVLTGTVTRVTHIDFKYSTWCKARPKRLRCLYRIPHRKRQTLLRYRGEIRREPA